MRVVFVKENFKLEYGVVVIYFYVKAFKPGTLPYFYHWYIFPWLPIDREKLVLVKVFLGCQLTRKTVGN